MHRRGERPARVRRIRRLRIAMHLVALQSLLEFSLQQPPDFRDKALHMNPRTYYILVCVCTLGAANAADLTWTTSPGVADTEVSTNGTQVFGYYFSSNAGLPGVVSVNSVPFTLNASAAAPAGLNFNGSFNNPEAVDGYQVPLSGLNDGLNQILDGQNWGGAAPLTVTNLAPGGAYEVQLMLSDDRASFFNARNYDVSDSNDPEGSRDVERGYHSTRGGGVPAGAPPGSVDAKIFTGTFTADAGGTQDIYTWLYEGADHSGGNSGSQVNAIQVRSIPEPTAFALAVGTAALLGLRRRRG